MSSRETELTTERLHLRQMRRDDLDVVTALGADERVMASLGGARTSEESEAWLNRQIDHWRDHQFGRFSVMQERVVLGFVGLSRADLDAGIVPGVEIAWRLFFDHWGHGYATEAARAVIQDGFARLGIEDIVGVTTPSNVRSRRVMERLGMVLSPGETFEHPALAEGHPLRTHVVYRLSNPS